MFKAKDYVKAESLSEAYELNQKKSNVLIGGMHWLKMGKRTRMTVIDLSDLGLNGIEETEDEFRIGCMCSLRQLETDEALNGYFNHIFKECTRHIVGVQFRNGATVGGSVFGRYGFSDVLTCLLALDTKVELYQGGIIPLSEFCRMKPDRDILVAIHIKKDGRKAAYTSQRRSKTDLPLIACGVAKLQDTWYFSVGARPYRAEVAALKQDIDLKALADNAADQFSYGSNLRGSAEYRKELVKVYARRLMEQVEAQSLKTVEGRGEE